LRRPDLPDLLHPEHLLHQLDLLVLDRHQHLERLSHQLVLLDRLVLVHLGHPLHRLDLLGLVRH